MQSEKLRGSLTGIVLCNVIYISADSGGFSDVVVEIERASRKKAYMGGYRHKKTGVEFHHASAQTVQKQRPVSAVEKFCRDTQTVQLRHQVQQTFNNMATQMTKIGVYVSNMEDKLVVPGHYTTAEEHHQYILKKVWISDFSWLLLLLWSWNMT